MPPRLAKSFSKHSDAPKSDRVPESNNPASGFDVATADPFSQTEVEKNEDGDVMEEEAVEEEEPEEELEEDIGEEIEEEMEEEEEEEMEEEIDGEEGQGDEEEVREVPQPIKEKRKQREFEVFVGGLPRDATESDLEEVFKRAGEVVEVRLVKSSFSNKNKGFAFVRFATTEQAKKAATELKRTVVKGKSCGVIRNNDNETLHLGNICTSWTKDDLVEKLKAFQLENLEVVHLIDDPHNKGMNRGYAFLDFRTHMDAVDACSKLQQRDVFFGTDKRAEISFSKTVEPDEEIMAQVKSVFLDGLPETWDEAYLRQQFKKFGEIESVQLASYMPTAKRKDFGFVCFRTREAALNCIEKVNKDGVGGGHNKVLIKATLKKPLLKRTPQTLGIRRGFIGKGFGVRGQPSYGFARSFAGKPATRSHESVGRRYSDRSGGPSRLSFRGAGLKAAASPPAGKYGVRPRRQIVEEIPGSAVLNSRSREPYYESRTREPYYETGYREPHYESRSRDLYYESRSRDPYHESRSRNQYYESSSSAQYSPRGQRYYSATYSQMNKPYSDPDVYDPRIEPQEAYEYHALPGYKRSYAEVDHETLESRSLTRAGRSRPGLKIGPYPQHGGSTYDEYPRSVQDEHLAYDRVAYASRERGAQYLSGSRASRSYY